MKQSHVSKPKGVFSNASKWVITETRILHGKAIKFAYAAHEGQVRKYTGVPYITHPTRVVCKLEEHGYTDHPEVSDMPRFSYMKCAGVLHDTVEDCDVVFKDIYEEFGDEVGDLVFWLTDVSKPEYGNRNLRKRLDRLHIQAAPFDAQIIKCADIIDNTESITEHDPNFSKVYLKEIKLILDGMRDDVKETSIFKEANQ